jgi:hypothetical protein
MRWEPWERFRPVVGEAQRNNSGWKKVFRRYKLCGKDQVQDSMRLFMKGNDNQPDREEKRRRQAEWVMAVSVIGITPRQDNWTDGKQKSKREW